MDAAQGGNISPASIGTSLAINAITEGVSSKTVKGQKGDIDVKTSKTKIKFKYDDVYNYEYSAYLNPGPLNDILGQPNRNFYGGRYNSIILEEPVILYRAGNSSRPLGQWFTVTPPQSSIGVRIDTTVKPQWIDRNGFLIGTSPIDTVYKIELPAGTTLYLGPVGSQGGIYQGGLDKQQIYIQEPWNIRGVKILDSWSME